ncbi:Uncharacterised protein [Mycobacterium tuberculosis]|uniref:Uncharacterized protein n=1 Tax=Mycobacterium tuberculosis TaxID=1773 RepID=A0A916LEM6_MYCTX|nr:Uncharacterised protein [Mycobacterium tuberculosis]COX25988.1 Uncharacterised protein [Mycobacterium tuberculosis]COZ58228.1 Uncharacterised protein [Mycobacterium tuberculosis]
MSIATIVGNTAIMRIALARLAAASSSSGSSAPR